MLCQGEVIMDEAFSTLSNLRFSDNICTVGWTCIHASGWDGPSIAMAKHLRPEGNFISTSYVDSDMRRMWTDEQRTNAQRYGAPIHILYRGAYFNFPVNTGGGKLLIALGMTAELLRLMAIKPLNGWQAGTFSVTKNLTAT